MARDDPHFRLRLPSDLRDRIKASAARNGRSINQEIVQVLSQYFPAEPTDQELWEDISMFLNWADNPAAPPYRLSLIDRLKRLQDRIGKGLDFEHVHKPVSSVEEVASRADAKAYAETMRRLREAPEPVTTQDLQAAIKEGFLRRIPEERLRVAIEEFDEDHPHRAVAILGLGNVRFASPEAANAEIEHYARQLWDEMDHF